MKPGIYIASKTVHGPRWRALREAGVPIISTWIDESEVGATSDWPDLWSRCIGEASSCVALVAYREEGETLKGGLVEVGAALASGRRVYAVGLADQTVRHHPLFHVVDTLEDALRDATNDVECARAAMELQDGRESDGKTLMEEIFEDLLQDVAERPS